MKNPNSHKQHFKFVCPWMMNISLCSLQVKREVGDVSILVNNAGIVTGKKFMDAPDSLIEKTVEVNTMAHFWVSQTQENCFFHVVF